VLLIAFNTAYGQMNVERLFRDFSELKDVSTVNVSGMSIKFAGMFTETMGVESIDVRDLGRCDTEIKERFVQAVASLKDVAFEPFINISENGKRTKVLMRIEDDVIREMIVVSTGDSPALVRIKGKISKSDIEKLAGEHSR
jgi:hypothetical protein